VAIHIQFEDLLMVKFYVVDGLSYPACEAAIGVFGHHGYDAMKYCRAVGYCDAKAKASQSFLAFRHALHARHIELSPPASFSDLDADALEYFLRHRGFGVHATAAEIGMARHYLVDGLTYQSAEKQFHVHDKEGFAAMYSVCKLGGFRGRRDRGSMTPEAFGHRLRSLGLA